MGLKQRLLQGQTGLSAGSFPGDTPINDPQSGFIQSNSPSLTYEDETLGQPNNGSILANTLDNTGLDNTLGLHDANKPISPVSTDFPSLSRGEFGGASSQYIQTYGPNNTYLSSVSIEDTDSPQLNTLNKTSLDNTNGASISNVPIPNSISAPTNYPQLASGEFGGSPTQNISPYNANNTYLSSIGDINATPQTATLDKTSLDNTNDNSISNIPIPNNISYPNDYPQPVSGIFSGAPSQYETPYNANNTYLDIVDTISIPANNNQVNTLDNTGLDNSNGNFDPTTFRPNSISAPTNYGNVPNSPSVQLGEFGGAPSQYIESYTPNGTTYLEQIDSSNFIGIQSSSLPSSGLSTDPSNAAPTTFIAPLVDNITTYPAENVTHNTLTSGLNSAPQPFVQTWGNNNPYYTFYTNNKDAFNPASGERQQYTPSLLEKITAPLTNTLNRIF